MSPENFISFILTSVGALFALWALLITAHTKNNTWKTGLYIGIVTYGLSAFGFLKPMINPLHSNFTWASGSVIMLGCLAFSYFEQLPDITEVDRLKRNHMLNIMKVSGILTLLMFLIVFILE